MTPDFDRWRACSEPLINSIFVPNGWPATDLTVFSQRCSCSSQLSAGSAGTRSVDHLQRACFDSICMPVQWMTSDCMTLLSDQAASVSTQLSAGTRSNPSSALILQLARSDINHVCMSCHQLSLMCSPHPLLWPGGGVVQPRPSQQLRPHSVSTTPFRARGLTTCLRYLNRWCTRQWRPLRVTPV
jgi:hypothetical protein